MFPNSTLTTRVLVPALMMAIFISISACDDSNAPEQNDRGENRDAVETPEDAGNGDRQENGTEKLSLPPKYRGMLRKEMVKLEGGMQQLLSHLVRGRKTEAARVALNIHESFILKQELSRDELKELQGLLPSRFVKLDQAFHKTSKKLSNAAEKGNFERAMSLYNDMTSGCITCHTRYASDRFPDMTSEKQDD